MVTNQFPWLTEAPSQWMNCIISMMIIISIIMIIIVCIIIITSITTIRFISEPDSVGPSPRKLFYVTCLSHLKVQRTCYF